MQAYERAAGLKNLLLDPAIISWMEAAHGNWRRVVGRALQGGIPVPGMSAGLAYYDSYRTARLPQSLTQAQRDAFGAHTYQRVDDPEGAFVHTEWLR